MEEKITINDHEAVDLGLNVKWATCNIGASNPEEMGDFFRFAEIKTPTNVSVFYNTQMKCVDITIIGLHYKKGYKRDRYKLDGKTYSTISYHISRSEKYDVAFNKWGLDWRIPTPKEFQELVDNCVWEWTSIKNKYGYKIIGSNGNSIFYQQMIPLKNEDSIIPIYMKSAHLIWSMMVPIFLHLIKNCNGLIWHLVVWHV